jgi:outer membrane protein W
MPLAPWLLITNTLIAPAPVPADVPQTPGLDRAGVAAAQQPPQRPGQLAGGTSQQDDPMHQIGLGAAIAMTNYGAGASFRYWFNDHLGLAMQATWSRRPYRSVNGLTTTTEHANAVTAMPSLTYLFGRADADRYVNLRPYLGLGGHYINASGYRLSSGATINKANGFGVEAYGGAELSFQEYPNLTISNELMYLKLPSSFVDSLLVHRWNYSVAVHFYLK